MKMRHTCNDGISFTANALLRLPAAAPARPSGATGETNRTELMRSALRAAGQVGMDAFNLALVADLDNSGLVGALLKYDIRKGRASFSDGRYYTQPIVDGDGVA